MEEYLDGYLPEYFVDSSDDLQNDSVSTDESTDASAEANTGADSSFEALHVLSPITLYKYATGFFSFWKWVYANYPTKVRFIPPKRSPINIDEIPINVINFSQITKQMFESYGFCFKNDSYRRGIKNVFNRAGISVEDILGYTAEFQTPPAAKRSQGLERPEGPKGPKGPEGPEGPEVVVPRPKVSKYKPSAAPSSPSSPSVLSVRQPPSMHDFLKLLQRLKTMDKSVGIEIDTFLDKYSR